MYPRRVARRIEEATAWVYRGTWGVFTKWFRVPPEPPSLPSRPGEEIRSFRPSSGFLRYLKFKFWFLLIVIDSAIVVGWLALVAVYTRIGLLLAPVAIVVAIVPDVIAYIAIHLRYDTTWYIFTERSMRIRRGIWVIHETTITFENIQNVSVKSGPLERLFGIANVIVDTAGGGIRTTSHGGERTSNYHQGLIEGIQNAAQVRILILNKVRHSGSAGLGDEAPVGASWPREHVAVLREIRDVLSSTS
jgi:membrane protein YdbS with pleckstrin-like domain